MSKTIDLFFEIKQRLAKAGHDPKYFQEAHIMEVTDEIYDAVMKTHVEDSIRIREDKSLSPPPIPASAKPPADTVVLGFPYLTEARQMFLLNAERDGRINMSLLRPDFYPTYLGSYKPGVRGVTHNAFPNKEHQDQAVTHLFFTAALFDLLNTPKFVTRTPLASRQTKRRLVKRGISGAEKWHKITWNLSEPKAPPRESRGGGWKMPLHYTRGHWRRSERAKKNVHVLNDGNTYQWIEGFWSGHPAFGIKRSYYSVVDKEKECLDA